MGLFWSIRRIIDPKLKPLKTKGFLVLGMHRSGTSCLTGLLETSGVWAGQVIMQAKHNLKGTRENRRVFMMNEEILRKSGGSWDNPPDRIVVSNSDHIQIRQILREYEDAGVWVMKDPRLLLTIDAWLIHLRQYQLIGTFRHPEAVAQSLYKRNEIPIEGGIELWLKYNRRLVELHRRYRFPLVQFDLLGEEYIQQYRALCLLLGLPFDYEKASEFYETNLVHIKERYVPPADRETRKVYDYLAEQRIKTGAEKTDC